MRIIIDADACPSINLVEDLAYSYKIPVIIYCDNTHNITSEYAEVITMDKGYQNVDIAIANNVKEFDIVLTQDYGLALIVLARKASAIHPKGLIYSFDNLNIMLAERHLNATLRRNGHRTRGPKKRNSDDDEKLIKNLTELISNIEFNKEII